MTTKEMLNQNIPAKAIETRSQGGKELSYLSGWYVIDRLNQVLGTDNWDFEIQQLNRVEGTEKPAFICVAQITATVDGKVTRKTGVGYGSDKSTFNAGEMAVKEAETDALKRAAIKLGRSLGLSLYDKTMEYVDEAETGNSSGSFITSGGTKNTKENTKTTGAVAKVTATGAPKNDARAAKAPAKEILVSAYEVLKAQKKITPESFTQLYMLGKKIKDASDIEVSVAVGMLNTDFPELKLTV